MSTTVAVADWIRRIADDERARDAALARGAEIAARKAELVRSGGRRIVDELRAAVTRDADAFRSEFAGDPTRDIVVDDTVPEGGFVVRKPAPAAVSLTVAPNLEAGVIICHYRFTLASGLPAREDRFDMRFAGDVPDALQMKHHGTGQVFASADALSEFLLVPVLTGRPR